MANLVAGKLGVVTGGGSGIGRAIAQMLGRHGASVLVVDIQEQHAKETAELLTKENSKGKFAAFAADVSQRDEIDNLSKYFAKDFAKQSPDFLVNSAGITRDSFLIKMNDQQYDDVLNVNLKSIYMLNQAFARLAIEYQKSQSIVNISSIVGKAGNIGQCNYAASKAGVIGFSKSAAKELARYNIRVNCIIPGFIKTPMTEKIPDKVLEKICKSIPLNRMGHPDEIANAALFLCSDLSSYMTGAMVEVTGGLDM
uniref:Estradiol 17-beta-dehydrogenase 8 n=1 Tax=Panagrolaimus sp. PS1159 TaxID=55785 RepID=A0AC35F3P5_9BILA